MEEARRHLTRRKWIKVSDILELVLCDCVVEIRVLCGDVLELRVSMWRDDERGTRWEEREGAAAPLRRGDCSDFAFLLHALEQLLSVPH